MKSHHKVLNHLKYVLLSGALLLAAGAHADVVVIVSAKSTITSLTAEQISKIFLGKVNAFPNGERAIPVDQLEGNAVRDEFYSKVSNKSASQLTAYWAKVIFTGDGQPPKRLEGNVAVRTSVANHPNTIGYVNRGAVDSSVRIILIP